MTMLENHYAETAAHWKRLYDTKAVNRKFPFGSWVPHGSNLIKSFVRPPVTRWAFSVINRNLSCLYMWTISNCARHRMRPDGARMSQLLNHCVLVRCLSDRALKSVMLHQHHLSMCPVGKTWPVTIRVKQPLENWTDRLFSPDMFYHRFYQKHGLYGQ